MRRAEHRGKVATKFAGVADVERQQVEQIVTQLAGIVEFDRRDTQPLLPDLGGRRIIATMGAAPDIALVRAHDGPEQTLAISEYRHEYRHIGQMTTAMIGVVEQDHIAGLDVLEPLLDRDRRPWQCADMDRQMIGLRDQARIGVADRQRKIAAGIEDLRIGGAKHGFAHLFHNRTEAMLDDGTRDGIDLGGHAVPLLFSCFVGWVERSETHHQQWSSMMGFASLYPSYAASTRTRDFRKRARCCI